MGFWRSLFSGRPDAVRLANPRFGVSADSGVLYSTPTLDDFIYKTGRISRAEALRVPAVKRARDLIAGGIGQLPLRCYDATGREATASPPAGAGFSPSLFTGVEAGIAPSIPWGRVVEDLLLFGHAWLRVTSVGWHGKPAEARRLDADTVTVRPTFKTYPEGTARVWPEVPGLIRIDSPNDGILDCSPAVRTCIALDRAALNFADGVPPIEYFTPAGDVDPIDDDEIADFLDDWAEARRERGAAYVPAALVRNDGGWDPAKLQLREAREFAITEVARLTGIDPEDLSVPTTSRTYFNAQDRRRARIEDVLGTYMTAIEGRMSMPDVSPRGYTAAFDTAGYLRLDDLSAAQADSILVASKILLPDEAREKRNLEPLGPQAEPADPAAIADAHNAVAAIETANNAN